MKNNDDITLGLDFFKLVESDAKKFLLEKDIKAYFPKIVEYQDEYYYAVPFFYKEDVWRQLGWIIYSRINVKLKSICIIDRYSREIDGSILDNPTGRTINPGHSIENNWLLMNYANITCDKESLTFDSISSSFNSL